MKIKLIILLTILTSFSTISAQKIGYQSYLLNYSFFYELNSDFLNYKIAPDQVKSLTEIRITLDSINNEIDTITKNRYLFDKLGQLIEKQYKFNRENTKFISISYSYKDGVCYDTILTDPYLYSTVLDGMYISQPKKIECNYNRRNILQQEEITFWEGEFNYVFLKYFYTMDNLETVEINTDKGNWRHEILYDYYKKKKY